MKSDDDGKPEQQEAIWLLLAVRLKQNDETVCREILVRLAQPAVKVVLQRYYWFELSIEDCDEIVQAAIRQLWETRSRYNPTLTRLDRWFFRLAKQAAVNLWRRRQNKVLLLPLFDTDGAGTDDDPLLHPGDCTMQDDSPAIVRASTAAEQMDLRSPDRQRLIQLTEAFVTTLTEWDQAILYEWAGANGDRCWTSALAGRLMVAPGFLRQRLFRLRRRLRTHLETMGYDFKDEA